MARVIIGVDPHKRSATIEVINEREQTVGQGRFGTDTDGYQAMLAAGRRHADRLLEHLSEQRGSTGTPPPVGVTFCVQDQGPREPWLVVAGPHRLRTWRAVVQCCWPGSAAQLAGWLCLTWSTKVLTAGKARSGRSRKMV